MILPINDPLWAELFKNIVSESIKLMMDSQQIPTMFGSYRDHLEYQLLELGIRIIKEDDRWVQVEIPDDEAIRMELYLRFGW